MAGAPALAVAGAQAPADLLAAGYGDLMRVVAWSVGRGGRYVGLCTGCDRRGRGRPRYSRPGGRRYMLAGWDETQGWREGVLLGVARAELIGQASRSAVILVHAEGLRQAPGR